MLSPLPVLRAVRAALSQLDGGGPVAQAYALQALTQAVDAATRYEPTRITARPRPTTEAVSVTLHFAGGYRLQVTIPYSPGNPPEAPNIILSLFRHDRLQYSQRVPRRHLAAHIAGALYPIS